MITRRCQRCFQPLFLVQKRYKKTGLHDTANAYMVLLPEVPKDTRETNTLMRHETNPEYSQITPDSAMSGCAKLSIEYEVEYNQHADKLKYGGVPKTFSNVFDPIEKISVPLAYAQSTLKNLSVVNGNPQFRTAFQRVFAQMVRVEGDCVTNMPIYNVMKELKADEANLNEHQRRLVDMFLIGGRNNGIEIMETKDREKLSSLINLMEYEKNTIRNRLWLSHKKFELMIDDFSKVSELPRSLIHRISLNRANPSRGPWKMTLDEDLYGPFMSHCSDRTLRKTVFLGKVGRCSLTEDAEGLSNHNTINEMRDWRGDLSKLVGFKNSADMAVNNTMAGSVETVLAMIENFKAKLGDLGHQEVALLQQFAVRNGFTDTLQAWDIDYWRHKQRRDLFQLDKVGIHEYFPLPTVLRRMWDLCQTLFGIKIKDCTGEVESWHQDVLYYRVYDATDKTELGAFYFDPYVRQGKMAGLWTDPLRDRSDLLGTQPLCAVIMCLDPPLPGRPSLLHEEDVNQLFQEMGNMLQQVLTTVPYSKIAGQNNIERDSVRTVSKLMGMLSQQPQVLHHLSAHYKTGDKLSQDVVTTLAKAPGHMSGYDMLEQLYLSAYDMELNIDPEHWSYLMTQTWPEYMPIPLHKDDNHPCSHTNLICGPSSGIYYSDIWSQMIAADLLGAFEEVGFDDLEQLAPVGKRFRDTYLALGGGVSASEVFRRFRGRDPTQEAIIEQYKRKSLVTESNPALE